MYHEVSKCRICKNSDHLVDVIDLGHQKITSRFPVYGDLSTPSTPICLCLCENCGLLQLKHNIACDESLVLENRLTSEDGVNAARQLMSLSIPPDAIFCGNDTTALSLMIYLRDKGYRIPQDIGIVGFSNEPFSRVVSPSISTIAQPGFEMGQKAAELIIRKIENKERTYQTIILPTELIIRESSKRKSVQSQ